MGKKGKQFRELCPEKDSCRSFDCGSGWQAKGGDEQCAGPKCKDSDREACCDEVQSGPKPCEQRQGSAECLENSLETCCAFKKGKCYTDTKCQRCPVGTIEPAGCNDKDPEGCKLLPVARVAQICRDQSEFADVFRRECPNTCALCNECKNDENLSKQRVTDGHSLKSFSKVPDVCNCNALCGAYKASKNVPYKVTFEFGSKKKTCNCYVGVHGLKGDKGYTMGQIF